MIRKQLLVLAVVLCSLTSATMSNTQTVATYNMQSGSSRALMSSKIEGWKGFYAGDSSCVSVIKNGAICGWTAVSAGLKCAWSYIKCIIPKCSKCCGGGIFSWACVPCKCSWDCSSKKCKEEFNKVGKTCKIATDGCVKAFNHLGAATKKFFQHVGNAIKDIANKIKHAAEWVAKKAWGAIKWVWDQIKKLLDLIKFFEVAKAIGQAFKCFGKLGSSSSIKNASKQSTNVKNIAQGQGKNGIISKIDRYIPGFKAFVCCMQSTAIGKVLNKWGKSLLSFHKSWKGLKIGSFLDDPAIVVSLAANAAAGVSVGTSLDIAISTAFNIGLYWSVCSGFVTDVGVGVSIIVNLFRKFSFIPGQSVAVSFSVGIPSTPIGVGAGVVLPIGSNSIDFGAVNVEVGASNGISPVSIGGHVCDTKKLVEFNLLELLGNILTANNECPSKIPTNGGGAVSAGKQQQQNKQPCAVFGCSCQGMSDKYLTHHGVTWGSAPAWARTWWMSKRCSTKPGCKLFKCSCQGMSDTYGTNHGITWGKAPAFAQQWWMAKKCSTRPSPAANAQCRTFGCTCQGMSNKYLTHHGVSWGSAPAWARTWWGKNACNTTPSCTVFGCSCQAMSNKYKTNHGVTWGSAPAFARTWWMNKRCSTRPKIMISEMKQVPIEQIQIENRRLLSNKILYAHKEKIMKNTEEMMREEIKTQRRLLEENGAVATENARRRGDAGPNRSPFRGIDRDVCGARNIAATKKFEEVDGVTKLVNRVVISRLCSRKCQKHRRGQSEPKQCRDLRARACARGLLGPRLNSELKCCRMLMKDPEDLVFHIRKLCAANGAVTKPTRGQFCAASRRSARQIQNNFDIVNTIIDGCVLHFSDRQCRRLKGIKKASVFARVARGLCNSRSRFMTQQLSEYSIGNNMSSTTSSSSSDMVIAAGMGLVGFAGVLFCYVLKNKSNKENVEFEEIL